MPTVIIIGFGYSNLPSTITDIYRVYSAHSKLGHRIYIGSDIIKPVKPDGIINLLASRSVDEKFIPFIENEFVKIRTLISDRDTLINFLHQIELTSDRNLLFYYTGHGVSEGLKMPDGNVYNPLDLRDQLLCLNHSKLNHLRSEIFIILDCCKPHDIYLPFKHDLNDGEFYQIGKHFLLPKILLIVPTNPDGMVEASPSESLFTKALYGALFNPCSGYDIQTLVEGVNDKLPEINCTVYSSRTSEKIIWSWVCSKFNFWFDQKNFTLNLKNVRIQGIK